LSTKPPKALIVDDEPSDLEALHQALTGAGYEVVTANDGKNAVDIFQAHGGEFDLLVTDVAMLPMNGCDLAAELVRLQPNLRVVFVSAYTGAQAFRYKGHPIASFAFLQKPLRPDTLLSNVRELLTPGKDTLEGPEATGKPKEA